MLTCMRSVARHFKETGAKMVGHWSADDYQHEDSKVAAPPYTFVTIRMPVCLISYCFATWS